jgi:hypothetical protein
VHKSKRVRRFSYGQDAAVENEVRTSENDSIAGLSPRIGAWQTRGAKITAVENDDI